MILRLWHSFTDTSAFRWFVKTGPGRVLFRSRAFKHLNVARNSVRSHVASRRRPEMFRDVHTFCFFVGHNKSGSSLLSGLLDAHPDVILSDEVDALQYVGAGFSRDQIFHMVDKGAQVEARKGRVTARRLEPYSYWVPGGWQGRCRAPLVVGDSTTGTSTRRIATDPALLDRLSATMNGVGVKLLHVIRNPFDPIAVMMVRGKRSFQNSIDHFFGACEVLVRINRSTGALLPVRYEDFVVAPEEGLAAVCNFLGVEAGPDYLSSCASIIRRTPDRSRDMVEWTRPWIDLVHRRIEQVDFLSGYSYDN